MICPLRGDERVEISHTTDIIHELSTAECKRWNKTNQNGSFQHSGGQMGLCQYLYVLNDQHTGITCERWRQWTKLASHCEQLEKPGSHRLLLPPMEEETKRRRLDEAGAFSLPGINQAREQRCHLWVGC